MESLLAALAPHLAEILATLVTGLLALVSKALKDYLKAKGVREEVAEAADRTAAAVFSAAQRVAVSAAEHVGKMLDDGKIDDEEWEEFRTLVVPHVRRDLGEAGIVAVKKAYGLAEVELDTWLAEQVQSELLDSMEIDE